MLERRAHGARIDDRIGVDKEETIAASGTPAGVASSGDLPMFDRYYLRAVLPRNLRCGVRRSIVHDDDFIGRANHAGRLMDRM